MRTNNQFQAVAELVRVRVSEVSRLPLRMIMCGFIFFVCAIAGTRAEEFAQRASWSQPAPSNVRTRVLAWAGEAKEIDELTQAKLDALWPESMPDMTGPDLLEQATATFALIDPRADEVVQFCRGQRKRFAAPEFAVLADEETSPLVRNNLRLLYGRWLAQQQLYDEASEVLQSVKLEEVVDPASLLFYQSVVHHRLLDKENCLPAIAKLLEHEDEIPRRYAAVAKLMEADLSPLKTDSLDEIARLMDSIRIELEHARAGKRVRERQEEVIAKLNKLIEDLEEQQRQQQQSSSSGGSSAPSKPADESNPLGGMGDGKVPSKKLGDASDWGNLPPKQREEALQEISKEFPSHFREVIEEYFRKLARDNQE